jgi:hypothetical protein
MTKRAPEKMIRESKSLAVKCKTGFCGAKIPLLSAVRSIFPKRESIASLLCPIGHWNQYTEADVIDTSRRTIDECVLQEV